MQQWPHKVGSYFNNSIVHNSRIATVIVKLSEKNRNSKFLMILVEQAESENQEFLEW